MDMKELRKNAEKVIAERFPDFNFSTLDWGELDPFYLEHPEEIPIEHEFVGYRQDGDVAEDYQGNLYLVLCDPGIHPIGSVCMDSVKRLTWIDPEAEVESMDYWFTGNDEYLETLCRIPDTVRSIVETFKNATAMTSMPDMSGADRLEDITSCAEGCIALEKRPWNFQEI